MRKVEKEEERTQTLNPDKQCFHFCIINLVIGTLYCAKVRGCDTGVGVSGAEAGVKRSGADGSVAQVRPA